MAYSTDFRQRVIDACDRGMTTGQVARAFGVAASWVRRLKQWRRERGSIMPRACGGSEPMLGPDQEAAIHLHFKQNPGTTIVELKQALETDASEVTVWRAARRLGYRFKRSRCTPPNGIGRTWRSDARHGRRASAASTPDG